MTQVLLIADDLTGALDCAVPFVGAGVEVCLTGDARQVGEALNRNPSVLAVNAATRHLEAAQARSAVSAIVDVAMARGVRCVFKKTDSVLRGNVGAELDALAAYGPVHFVPAYPQMNRIVVEGVLYVDGVPVADSALGADPFEPVTASSVRAIIAAQSAAKVRLVRENEPVSTAAEGIAVYDAASERAVDARAAQLLDADRCALVAGCAGLAGALAQRMGIPKSAHDAASLLASCDPHLLALCGSVNPVSVGQCRYAERQGTPVFPLEGCALTDPAWAGGPEGTAFAQAVADSWATRTLTVVDGSTPASPTSGPTAGRDGCEAVASHLARALIATCCARGCGTVLVMGGDVLRAFLREADVSSLEMLGEVERGVVLSRIPWERGSLSVISKSGGFGAPSLFTDLARSLEPAPAAACEPACAAR